MSNNGVVSIRVEALGVSITIADGNIAIEQTKTESSATNETVPVSVDDSPVRRDSGAGTPVIDALEQTPRPLSPPGSNGPTELPAPFELRPVEAESIGEDQEARSARTKPPWSDEEVEKLKTLYPTHSASAIATQLGRGRNSVRSKAQNLGLRKDGPPTVTSKPAKPPPRPRSLSAAVTTDSPAALGQSGAVGSGFSSVSLLDHHSGQCRWIVSDGWPVVYCGAPVVDSSSWCEQHSRRVFNHRSQSLGVSLRKDHQLAGGRGVVAK